MAEQDSASGDDGRPHPNRDPLSQRGFHEDGIYWEGSRDSLEAWKLYKRTKAHAFVERGYSVSWSPDGDGWMSIFLPRRPYAGTPEIRAEVKFHADPSSFGIREGRISKLAIMVFAAGDDDPDVLLEDNDLGTTLYNYDRGLDVDHLHTNPQARALYDAVLEELN